MANDELVLPGNIAQPTQEGGANEQAQPVVAPQHNAQVQPQVQEGVQQPNDNAWVGGVKRESRQKGYNEGYQKAVEEFKQQFADDDSNAPVNQNVPNPSTAVNSNPAQPAYTPEQIATYAADQAAERLRGEQLSRVANQARQKYGSDYDEKIQQYTDLAIQYDQSNNPDDKAIAHDMRAVILKAGDLGDPDLVYQIASDEKFKDELLNSSPRTWNNKLSQRISAGVQNPTAHQMAAQRVQGSPVQDLPQSSTSYNKMSEISWEEKCSKVR